MPKYKLSPEERAAEQEIKENLRNIMKGLDVKNFEDLKDVFKLMVGEMLENGLEGELDDELGYTKYDYRNKESENSRNGYSKKTLKTSFGETEIKVPRDRDGEFEPQLVEKNLHINGAYFHKTKVSVPPYGLNAFDIGVSEYAKAQGATSGKYWVFSKKSNTAPVFDNGKQTEKELSLQGIGVVPKITIRGKCTGIYQCDTCGKFSEEKSNCPFCADNGNDIKKEYFTNTFGTVTTKCNEEGCNNYIAYHGKTESCSKHSNHCSDCDVYITSGRQQCNECLSFTNKYGTRGTKCAQSGCPSNIASRGDSRFCEYHSNRCLKCKTYIDSDAMYCMECIEKTVKK